ncbi:ABC transporter permease [Helicobacter canadensis]|uniref:ABC-type transport system, permease component n=1 Tax=Helicobacter canadensis MIT 98-5491 TaxID=537970 RepID=C5ZVD4_9HELI|nr:ABC transporter permease [Helicobacter canadensis]EES88793.1 ABC-type transport system, permease component [Helicobacter canadensis MIT 98-5491]EFR48909.1 efflux ABC transporter, permease protein [Helicobacter canadensis MIT 98-5491]STP00059.1 ABC transporter [Helicobacter canadensis]
MILNAFFLAFRQIKRNFLRAILTMLGVIIGVGAVIIMITLGNGTTQVITERMSSLGSNILLVFPARDQTPGKGGQKQFMLQDIEDLKLQVGYLTRAIAPLASASVLAQFRQSNTQTQAQGINAEYFIATDWGIAEGREFSKEEYRSGSNVCMIGESVRKNLFSASNINPLGARIRLGSIVCDCIGILESKGQGAMGNDQDDVILLPLKTYQRSISKSDSLYNISRLMISLKDDVDSTEAVGAITEALRGIRNIREGQKNDFEIMDTKQIIEMMQSTTANLTLFLGAIAGVSLIVGGIGIMNIMLVSVTERTKEIGTRLAIGALESEVLLQFLIEAVTLSSLGGFIGIVLAFFGSLGICHLMEIPFSFDYGVATIAFLFSAFIGVLFGYLPARRASRLNPIDALRHE